jgi:hypothetical protein
MTIAVLPEGFMETDLRRGCGLQIAIEHFGADLTPTLIVNMGNRQKLHIFNWSTVTDQKFSLVIYSSPYQDNYQTHRCLFCQDRITSGHAYRDFGEKEVVNMTLISFFTDFISHE